LARKPEGRIKKLPTAPEVLMKSLRDVFFIVILSFVLVLTSLVKRFLLCLTFFRFAREERVISFLRRDLIAIGI
jgi:hypothetical protein